MKTWKIFVLILISIITLLKDVPEIKGCAGGDFDPDGSSYNFYDQTLNGQQAYYPFLFSFHTYFPNYTDTAGDYNCAEWMMEYFENKVPENDIATIVYTDPLPSLKLIRRFLKGEKLKIDSIVKENKCYQRIISTVDTDFMDYIIYARLNQPQTAYYDWTLDKQIEPEFPDYGKTVKDGLRLYKKSKSAFLKLKYGFQLTRLSHYAGRYDDCIKWYNEMVLPYKNWNYTKYRSLCHKAGALEESGDMVTSTYLFSYVFDRSPAFKMIALQGYKIKTNEDFNACLKLCREKREKTTLYLMRGLAPFANGLEEMEEIYKIDPFSNQIDILLSREIKMLEIDYLNISPPSENEFSDLTYLGQYDISYLRQMRFFLAKLTKNWQTEKKTMEPAFWQISSAYLALYDKEFDVVDEYLLKLKNVPGLNSWEKTAIRNIQIAREVSALNSIDRNEIDRIFKDYQNAEIIKANEDGGTGFDDSRFRYFMDKLAVLYGNSGDTAMSFLCRYSFNDLYWSENAAVLDGIMKWKERKDLNSFEKFMLVRGGTNDQNNEMKGSMLLTADKPEEALKYFRKVGAVFVNSNLGSGRNSGFYILAKPFDFYHADNVEDDDSLYEAPEMFEKNAMTKLDYAEKLISLKKEANKKGEKAAIANFKLGNAYYNTTWYGHAWMATSYYRSAAGAAPFCDLNTSLKYFLIAMAMTKDKELAAKCAYMAAKCELMPALSSDWNYKILHSDCPKICLYYDKLKNDYSETAFYKEMIRECSYLRDYVK